MKTKDKQLFLYEEAMLLALRDEKGTVMTSFPDQVVAGAVLAELLLDGRYLRRRQQETTCGRCATMVSWVIR